MAGKRTQGSLRWAATAPLAISALLALAPARSFGVGPAAADRVAGSAAVLTPPTRFVIGLPAVVAAIGASKLPLDGAAITLPAPMLAARAEPPLEVRSVEPWGDRRARILLRCEEHADCLPFYAVAEWPTAASAQAALPAPLRVAAKRVPLATSPSPLPPARAHASANHAPEAAPAGLSSDQSIASSSLGTSPAVAEPLPSPAPTMMRAGTRAKLLLEQGPIHIELPVVCLEGGSLGRLIRVRALHSEQTYMAEVLDASIVKGTL